MFKKRSAKDIVADTGIYFCLILLCLSIAYPFYYLIINSMNGMLSHGPSYIFPRAFTMVNYKIILSDYRLVNSFFVSVLRTITGIVFTVLNTAMCAFALRKNNLVFRNFYLVIFTIPMFFNGGLIPGYLNLKRLGLLNNFWVYIIPSAFAFFYVIIFMSYFNDISEALEESATIDGAGYFTILVRIYLPISLPVLATMALFAGVGQWNSWFDTLFYTNSPKLMTLSAVLMKIVRENNVNDFSAEMMKDIERHSMNPEGVKFATMLLSILPITMFYPFLQKYFVKGIMIGSIKG